MFLITTSIPLQEKIEQAFPKAIRNKELVEKVSVSLTKYDYGSNSLLATSLCSDELARPLETDFKAVYGEHFSMGGMAGFPFAGVTSFQAMAAHVPDGGSCLIVYGPHVGVDTNGVVGTVERRGRVVGGACCGSAVVAYGNVTAVHKGEVEPTPLPTDSLDAQQAFVRTMLLPHAKRLVEAEDGMVELPFVLFELQKKLMTSIISAASGSVAEPGKIAVLGGIQINTPPGMSDYFMPLQFDLLRNDGAVIDNLLWKS